MKKLTTLSLAIAATGMMASQSASAQVIAQETFTYFLSPPEYLNGLNGGTGWGGAWSASTSAGEDPRIKYTGSAYPGYGNSTPNLEFRSDYRTATRALDTAASGAFDTLGYLDGSSNIGADGTELWISVYYERVANEANGGVGALILRRDGTTSAVTTKKSYTNGDPHLYVMHIQFNAGADTVTTYFDPNLSAPPTGGVVTTPPDASFDAIQLAGQFDAGASPFATIAFDNIKIGATAADVGFSPVSESVTIVSSSFDLDADPPTATVTFTSNPAFTYKVLGSVGDLDSFELDLSGPITPAAATTETTTTVDIPEATSFFMRVEETQP